MKLQDFELMANEKQKLLHIIDVLDDAGYDASYMSITYGVVALEKNPVKLVKLKLCQRSLHKFITVVVNLKTCKAYMLDDKSKLVYKFSTLGVEQDGAAYLDPILTQYFT